MCESLRSQDAFLLGCSVVCVAWSGCEAAVVLCMSFAGLGGSGHAGLQMLRRGQDGCEVRFTIESCHLSDDILCHPFIGEPRSDSHTRLARLTQQLRFLSLCSGRLGGAQDMRRPAALCEA